MCYTFSFRKIGMKCGLLSLRNEHLLVIFFFSYHFFFPCPKNTISQSPPWRLQIACMCLNNTLKPKKYSFYNCLKYRRLRPGNIFFKSPFPLHWKYLNLISCCLCAVIYGNKENAPQNKSLHPDFASVNSFNGFSETSRALAFWEITGNLLFSGR